MNRRANNGSLYASGARPLVDPLATLPSKSWQETMVGQCKSALAVQPKKAHAVLFYSQVIVRKALCIERLSFSLLTSFVICAPSVSLASLALFLIHCGFGA